MMLAENTHCDVLKLSKLESVIGYKFVSRYLLNAAFTHSSVGSCNRYDNLEFLGDRVLGLVVSKFLFDKFPNSKVGYLVRLYNRFVSGDTLASVSRKLNFEEYFCVIANTQISNSMLADLCEALLGAIFIDSGFLLDVPTGFFVNHWPIEDIIANVNSHEAKNILQEWLQGHHLPLPKYKSVGKDVNGNFVVSLQVEGYDEITGTGRKKRLAEQNVASDFIAMYIRDDV